MVSGAEDRLETGLESLSEDEARLVVKALAGVRQAAGDFDA